MAQFETFKKASIPFSRQPRITIQKRGTITINIAAFGALGEPAAVELLYDTEARVLGLRAVSPDVRHAVFVRPSSRYRRGPWIISAMAFIHHYGIDTTVARRWEAHLDGDVLIIRLDVEGEVVSKAPNADTDQPRRRPRPRR